MKTPRDRRPGVVVVLLLLAALSAPAPPLATAQTTTQPTTQPTPSPAVRLVVDEFTPGAPGPADTLRISGRLVNESAEPLTRVRARLRVGGAPLRRTDIAEPVSDDTMVAVRGADVPVVPRLEPGASARWRLEVPVTALDLDEAGAYAVAVVARATSTAGRRDAGRVTTFLPWLADAVVQPTRLVWLWPLADTPVRDAGGGFLDDHLATALAAGRPLGGLPAAPAGRPVTWAVDPDLVTTAAAMASGYRVRQGAAGAAAGEGAAVAGAWLASLRQAIRGAEVLSLGYADPDAVALQRAGLAGDLTNATTNGPAQATRVLGTSVTGDVAWAPGGFLDAPTLETLRAAGARTVVLEQAAAPPAADLTHTPSGRAAMPTPAGPVEALVADAGLSSALGGRLTSQHDAVLAGQRMLADVATIGLQRPSDSRVVLVTPPRRWRPAPAVAAALLDRVTAPPFVRLVPLSELRAAEPGEPRESVAYPAAARRAELPPAYLASVRSLRNDLRALGSILVEPTADAEAFDLAILRTQSAAWRGGARRGGEALVGAVRRQLDRQRGAVHLVVRRDAILTGSTGTLSVTVANELDQPVVVGVVVTPSNRARLHVTQPGRTQVPARTNAQLRVPVRAIAGGPTTAQVQLVTPQGQPYGSAETIRVNATSIGRMGLVLIGGALAALFVTAGFRVVRRVRRATATTPPDPSGTPGGPA